MKETTLDNSIESKRRRRRALKKTIEKIMNAVFFVCGAAAIAAVALITVYMVVSGLPAIQEIGLLDFLFGTEWKSTAAEPKFGILPFILTSIWGTLGAIVIGVPVGLLTAVFLSKVASRRVASVVRPAVELLAGIPSVVYGFFGIVVLVPMVRALGEKWDGSGNSMLTASILLAIMILPTIIGVVEPALRAVPRSDYEGALALGYTLGEQYRDQGYAVEACAAVLAYAFDELDSPVVSAGHELTNQRSRRVFKKLGFTCEGTARRARMLSDGEYADEIRYSLLREEYRPQPAPK